MLTVTVTVSVAFRNRSADMNMKDAICPIKDRFTEIPLPHCSDIIMGAMASQITSLTIVYSTTYSGVDQRKLRNSASLAFVRGIHRWPVNSPQWPVTRKKWPKNRGSKGKNDTQQEYVWHFITHAPVHINDFRGVCVQGMWNAQVKGQVTETHRLKVSSHCDIALFISVYDITMAQP